MGDEVTAEELLEAARPATSPIHDTIDWDKNRCVARDQLRQMKHNINHLRVVIDIVDDGRPRSIKAWHNVVFDADTATQRRAYVPVVRIFKNYSAKEQILAQAKAEIASWRNRYKEYQDVFGGVFGEIDKLIN
jgi:hypothetical protein